MLLGIYRAVTTFGLPLIRLYLAQRKARGKEDIARFGERLGRPGRPRPDGPLVWLHGASVGESLSMLPLIRSILDGERTVLVTTGTVTSARMMAERLPAGALHQYVPVDRLAYVRRFLDHWRPGLVLWAESEFWPNMLSEAASRRIPMVLVNGRVSPRSFAGWRKARGAISDLLGGFSLCLGQTEGDASRLAVLGAAPTKCLGNLKFAAPPLPADADELARVGAAFGDRPRWLAASTHAGEEEAIGRVHMRLKERHADLLTVIAPRHPDRGSEIAVTLRAGGISVAVRSENQPITPDTDIYLADTLGELGLFFRLVDVVFMGKSLVPLGGQNPLEPARLECAVLFGPHMANFQEIAQRMMDTGGATEVADEEALSAAVERLLGDTAECRRQAAAGGAFATAEADVMEAVMAELTPFLDALSEGGDDHAGA